MMKLLTILNAGSQKRDIETGLVIETIRETETW
jgi:hypothetical protein